MAARGQKLSEAYVELHADDSKLRPEVKVKATKVGKEFGGQLNKALKQVNLDAIDIKADPKSALAAVALTEEKLRAMSRDAATVEIRVRTEKALKDLGRFRKQLGDVGEEAGPEAASGFAARFSSRIGPLLANAPLSPPLLIAAAAAAGAIAPLLGGAISGAIIGGAGIGGVVGGIMLAAKDRRVATAGIALGDALTRRLKAAGQSFVAPTLEGLRTIQSTLAGIDIESILSRSSSFVKPLAEGASTAISALGAAIEQLVANAGPVISVIGAGIAQIGQQLGAGLASLADNGETAAVALRTIFGIVAVSIGSALQLVNVLTELYGIMHKLGFDFALQTLLKITGTQMDKNTASTNTYAEAQRVNTRVVEQAKHSFVALNEQLQLSVDRNLSAAESMIALREATKSAREAVDKKSRVTDAEKTALIGMARAANNATKTLDEQGRTTAQATRAHESNRRKLIEVADRMGYTRKQARNLADQYLATPKNVNTAIGQPGMPRSREQMAAYRKQQRDLDRKINTSIKVTGDRTAMGRLDQLLIRQQALGKGISISAAQSAFKKNAGYHDGGWTGPGAKYDPAGIVHADEFVLKKDSRRKIEARHPGLLNEMNATGQLPGHAGGGLVAPFPVNAAITKIMSLTEALSKVTPTFNKNWPSSPSAQRGDSGVWRQVVKLIKSGPKMGSFGNAYRPGDPKWHGSGRAVDWMGFNMDALASFLASKGPLELIHRTKRRDYAYTRGRNKGSFNNALMEAHRNHVHIAMAEGGRVPLMDKGGRWPSGTIRANMSGRTEVVSTGANMDDAVALLSETVTLLSSMGREIGRQVGMSTRNADALIGTKVSLYSRTA